MKYSKVLATGALAFAVGAHVVDAADVFERQQDPEMESHTSTDGRIYKDGVLKASDPNSDDRVLGINHTNALITPSQSGSWGYYGDEDGIGNALVDCDVRSTCDVAPGAASDEISFESSGEYYVYVDSTAPYYSQAPVFRTEGDSIGSSSQKSTLKQKLPQAETVSGTLRLKATKLEGDTAIAPGSTLSATYANSNLTALYMGGRWTIFGTVQRGTTSNPSAPPVNILELSLDSELLHQESATQVIAPNGLFEASTNKDASLKSKSTDHVSLQDETRWDVEATLRLTVEN